MKEYLQQNKLSFNAYIANVYNGNIWLDKYIVGALGKMFNMKISIISPYFTDLCNVFHDRAIPDIVLVSNGQEFTEKNRITHFSMTKGKESSWNCVGKELMVGEIGYH